MTKPIRFVSSAAEKEFNKLPEKISTRFKQDLRALQKGSRPFTRPKDIHESVGDGALELTKNGRPAYRTIYVAKMKDAIWVLHSFVKTTNGVDRKAMATAQGRYKMMKEKIEEGGKGVVLELENDGAD